MSQNWPAVASLLFNALIFGVSWWPFRELYSRGLHSLWATAFAYGIVTIAIILWRPRAFRQVMSNPSMLLLFVAAGLTNSAFNWGVLVGDVIRVVLLFYLMPVWAILLGRWILHEAISPGAVARMALALSGASLILYEPGLGLPVPQTAGEWLGLTGGFFFAVTNITLKHQRAASMESKMLAMFAGGTMIPASLALTMMQMGYVSAPGPIGQWILGLPGDATDYKLDDQYRLSELNYTQNGKTWKVVYGGDDSKTQPALPSNMELTEGSQRIKLKMDNWIAK